MAPRWRMASWISAVPTARAVCAGTASVKKIHTCAPAPDWEISSAAGTPALRAALTYARASSIAVLPSKSAASHQQVLFGSIGYRPMNRSCRDCAARCSATTSGVSGSRRAVARVIPLRQPPAATGIHPFFPVRGSSQRFAYVSLLARKRSR